MADWDASVRCGVRGRVAAAFVVVAQSAARDGRDSATIGRPFARSRQGQAGGEVAVS